MSAGSYVFSVVFAFTCHYVTLAAGTGTASASGTLQPFLSIFRNRASVSRLGSLSQLGYLQGC